MSDSPFDKWWFSEGIDQVWLIAGNIAAVEKIRKLCEMAWQNGAYKATFGGTATTTTKAKG